MASSALITPAGLKKSVKPGSVFFSPPLPVIVLSVFNAFLQSYSFQARPVPTLKSRWLKNVPVEEINPWSGLLMPVLTSFPQGN